MRFNLGIVVYTPAFEEAVPADRAGQCLAFHHQGFWGDLDEHDRHMNESAVDTKERIMSVYTIKPSDKTSGKFYIITDPGHEQTTLLMPEDY